MKGYLIARIEISDPGGFEEYRRRVPAVIEQHGGRYLIRGGTIHPLEGAPPSRLVVLEFPSLDAARAFYASPEYAPLLALRLRTSSGDVCLVEGYEPPA